MGKSDYKSEQRIPPSFGTLKSEGQNRFPVYAGFRSHNGEAPDGG